MDDLGFYVPSSAFHGISEQWESDNERDVQWNPVYG